MPTAKKKSAPSTEEYLRIPVTLKGKDKPLALAVKQAVERREGRTVSWAALIRIALRTQAGVEGVKCK